MRKRKVTLKFLILLVCLLTLAGCKDTAKEKDKALAEAEKVKAELERLKAKLKETQSERDQLREAIAEVSEEFENTKLELTTAIQSQERWQTKFEEVAKQRDVAIAKVKETETTAERLWEQLKEETAAIREYQQWVKELQSTIADLEGQVPDVEFIPTPQDVVDKMLELANIKKDDLVYDLGCGDGRIVVTAAKRYGCKAVGYDIDPQRVKESLENVEKNNVGHLVRVQQKNIFTVGHLVRIQQKNIFTLDLSKADVITLYLLPELNVELIPQLEKLKPGSRIVSHDFGMEGVQPDKVITVNSNEDEDEHEIYLWISPLKKIPD
jgi:tRNA/tmRNA/rRNA uracil-C5-methylase (TrmA/RlmC/RlmD family)